MVSDAVWLPLWAETMSKKSHRQRKRASPLRCCSPFSLVILSLFLSLRCPPSSAYRDCACSAVRPKRARQPKNPQRVALLREQPSCTHSAHGRSIDECAWRRQSDTSTADTERARMEDVSRRSSRAADQPSCATTSMHSSRFAGCRGAPAL